MTGTRKPMTVAAILEAAYPLIALAGQTPKQTFYGVLYGEAKADGVVVKAGTGQFKLNPALQGRRRVTSLEAQARESFAATCRASRATSPSPPKGPRSPTRSRAHRARIRVARRRLAAGDDKLVISDGC